MCFTAGQLVPFQPKKKDTETKKEKKWSMTEWEDKRMRHTSGRICVHTLYCIATLLLIITFIAFFTDVYKTYNNLLSAKESEIEQAKLNYTNYCNPINDANRKNCLEYNKTANQIASNEITMGGSIGSYFNNTANSFADGLAWKTIGTISLLLCMCACGSSCKKFMGNVAEDPTQFHRARMQQKALENRRKSDSSSDGKKKKNKKNKKKKKRDSSSSSDDDEQMNMMQWQQKQQMALQYGNGGPGYANRPHNLAI